MTAELLLGCGYSREKRMCLPGNQLIWRNLVTADYRKKCSPDIVCDLDDMKWMPFLPEKFSEVHAYEVLEHLGSQGYEASFFSTFDNIWRILIPGGYLFATVPSRFSPWLWGDPGHRRAILPESLIFLDQTAYDSQVGVTMMSDYRDIYKSDFKVISSTDDHVLHKFILQAIKPARNKK
jgi:hypothetical protein